ncbi:EAL domain-containing protein [Herminiimonas sp. NPDC097707]|uniref:EAL domain-containing protein n=1 Tax=Herminiimonas sp. NPDC097707 TaxID=3364007 RepID=UPI00383BD92F
MRLLGIKILLDDFGTVYSSLSYLKCFPVDTLKIELSFVRDLATSQDSAAIVKTIISLGHNQPESDGTGGRNRNGRTIPVLTEKCL